jgi:uncharacterized protein YceK
MNNSTTTLLLAISLLMVSGCASIPKDSGNPETVRCTTVYEKQTVNSDDLNDNAIAFLFGKDKEPSQYRQTITEVTMTAYGSPVNSDKCQRWMSVKGWNETRIFDLSGWDFK